MWSVFIFQFYKVRLEPDNEIKDKTVESNFNSIK